jgi:hypothetical protein
MEFEMETLNDDAIPMETVSDSPDPAHHGFMTWLYLL